MERRVRPTQPPQWWEDLGSWARLSLAGVVAAGLLAIGLGWYIPQQVEERYLQAQVEADQSVLAVLLSTQALVPGSGADLSDIDDFVDRSISRGDFSRVKLWSPDGTIIYSDETQLIGQTFPLEEDFVEVLETGVPLSHLSDLSADENQFERTLGDALLETYLPVMNDGEVVAVWEVYRTVDRLGEAVTGTRTVVWGSVALGLGLLALFLVSAYGALFRRLQRKRHEAEARSDDLATLLEVTRSVTRAEDPDVLAHEIVDHLCGIGGVGGARITLVRDETEEVLASSGADVDAGPVVTISVPDRGDGLLHLDVAADSSTSDPPDLVVLEAALEEFRIGLERIRLTADREQSRIRMAGLMERLVNAQEDERRRIVGEVHDGLGQDLHRVLFGLRGSTDATDETMRAQLSELEELVIGSSQRLRRLLHDLRPSTIEDVGLVAALYGLAERMHDDYRLNVDLHLALPEEPSIPVRVALYRIAQEALHNVVKHAGTHSADLTVARDNGSIELRVADAGHGLAATASDGLGMWLMQERARAVGGSLVVDSGASGTSVLAIIPTEAP